MGRVVKLKCRETFEEARDQKGGAKLVWSDMGHFGHLFCRRHASYHVVLTHNKQNKRLGLGFNY